MSWCASGVQGDGEVSPVEVGAGSGVGGVGHRVTQGPPLVIGRIGSMAG
jgi:hypothetical protein